MPDDLPRALAEARCALVVAPAGCGKTHLISTSVQCCTGRQLILTHTHAGVRAIRDRMALFRVSPERYHVATIASFALRYAAAFPTLSGWTIKEPEAEQWNELLPAALAALGADAVAGVVCRSYAGLFVDEYQDCTKGQHQFIGRLAQLLPCRVLGDPLQSVFAEVNKEDSLPWAVVRESFPLLGELGEPHRWLGKNDGLGYWLLDVRHALLKGQAIDLARERVVRFVSSDNAPHVPLAECKRMLGHHPQSALVVRKFRPQCHKLSGSLSNSFVVFEDANGVDLLKWARKIDESSGPKRVGALGEFALAWLTGVPTGAVTAVVEAVAASSPLRAKRPDLRALGEALVKVRDTPGTATIPVALDALLALKEKPIFRSREVWHGLHEAARKNLSDCATPLRDAAWRARDHFRRHGRTPPVRCLGTPLLVKGLEFDHALVLNTAEFPDAAGLYVALTRASRSLTLVGPTSVLRAILPT